MHRKNLYLMYAVALLQGMVFYGPVATLYREAQGVSILQITLIESISLALCLLLELPWGVLADRIGYRRTMIFCCGLYFVSKIVFWRAAGFAAFLLERVMLSVVVAGMSGVETSILYLSCEKGQSQRAFGVYNGMLTAGLLIASVVFSLFVRDDFRLAGFLTVVSYGLAALLALFLDEVHPEEPRRAGLRELAALLRTTFRDRRLLLFLLCVALLGECNQTVTVFLSQLQYVRCGLPAAVMGYLYFALTLTGLCGVFSARLTRRLGANRTAILLFCTAAAACLTLFLTGSALPSVAAILLLRAANSLFQPLQTELQNERIATAERATALSINALLIDSVGVGTNLAFGALAEASLPGAFLFGAGLCTAGAVLFALSRRKGRAPADPTLDNPAENG